MSGREHCLGRTMESSCPDCGAEAGFVEQTARVLRGTCVGCGRTFTIVQDVLGPSVAPSPSNPGAAAPPGPTASGSSPAPVHPAGPTCQKCGAPLALRASSGGSFEARCRSCSSTFRYVLETPAAPRPPARFVSQRPLPSREGRPVPPGSNARPCRNCGGPLRFTTDPAGNVTGVCSSCGNRFTLPPRRDFGGRPEGRDGRRGEGRPFGPTYRRPGRWSGGPNRELLPRFRGSIGAVRPNGRRRENDENGRDARRRRRPRRE
jgi:hypothetical protein